MLACVRACVRACKKYEYQFISPPCKVEKKKRKHIRKKNVVEKKEGPIKKKKVKPVITRRASVHSLLEDE